MVRDEYVPRYEYERLESEYRRLIRKYEELEAYKEELERLVSKAKAPPLDIGFVVEKLEDGAVVNINGALKVLPYGLLSDEDVRNLKEGQYVFIGHIPDKKSPTGFTVGITKVYNKMVDLIVGEVEEIRREGDEWIGEISTGRGHNKIYKRLSEEEKKALKEGMKVGMIPVTYDIKKYYRTKEFSRYEVTKSPGVSFNDIGGLKEVKKELIRSIILPMLNPDDYAKYGERSRRILMYGPPGCGKTMCAKALATALPNCEFVKVGAGELFSMWLGESERNVRMVFKMANEKLESGENDYGVIFFDEIDALAQERGMYVGSSGAPERVTGQLLDILEGFYDLHPHLTVIGATNRLHLIDSALRSRFDKIIEVPKPDKEAALSIAEIYAKKVPLDALLVEEWGGLDAARDYIVREIVDYMYTDDLVETEIGTIRRRDSITGRFIAQTFYYARDKALEERTIFMLKKGMVAKSDIAEVWKREGLDSILDVEGRAVELSRKYKSPSEIGVTLEHLKEGFNRFLKRRAEEMIAAGYHKKLEEDTGMHF
ncbi:MAG: AAA+-type ATPase [Candidatus Alkanophagales archaeon MCA70_species_1]|nr:AAA+-type ATPase [Candidatus Alkanophaga volatiphilum]